MLFCFPTWSKVAYHAEKQKCPQIGIWKLIYCFWKYITKVSYAIKNSKNKEPSSLFIAIFFINRKITCKKYESQSSPTCRLVQLLLEVTVGQWKIVTKVIYHPGVSNLLGRVYQNFIPLQTSLKGIMSLIITYKYIFNLFTSFQITLNPIIANMIMAANTDVPQFVIATNRASLKSTNFVMFWKYFWIFFTSDNCCWQDYMNCKLSSFQRRDQGKRKSEFLPPATQLDPTAAQTSNFTN